MNNRLFLFLSLFASYFIVTFNVRAFTKDGYLIVAITDLALAMLNFYVIKKIQESKNFTDALYYAAGGTTGSMVSMLICNHFNI